MRDEPLAERLQRPLGERGHRRAETTENHLPPEIHDGALHGLRVGDADVALEQERHAQHGRRAQARRRRPCPDTSPRARPGTRRRTGHDVAGEGSRTARARASDASSASAPASSAPPAGTTSPSRTSEGAPDHALDAWSIPTRKRSQSLRIQHDRRSRPPPSPDLVVGDGHPWPRTNGAAILPDEAGLTKHRFVRRRA